MFLSCDTSLLEAFRTGIADGRCDARPMEPVCSFEDLVEIEILRFSLGNRRMSPVVNHLRGPHRCTCLCIIKTDTVAAPCDEVRVDPIFTHRVDSDLSDFVLRQLRNENGLMAVVGTADGHVSLAAARDNVELVSLNKTIVTFR